MPTANSQKLEQWFARFEHRMDTRVPHVISSTAIEYYKERFTAKNWDGKAWPQYGARRKLAGKSVREPRRGSLMMRSNNLFASIRESVNTPQRVRISAGSGKVPYARIHNEGSYMTQRVGTYTNNNFMGKGKPVSIKAHSRSMNMPKRQYMGHSAVLNQRIINRLKIMFKEK